MEQTTIAQGGSYGNLTVTKLTHGRTTTGHITCLAKCVCGHEYEIARHRLRNRKPGCNRCHFGRVVELVRGPGHPAWRGCGDLSGAFFSRLKRQGSVRGLSVTVSLEALWEQFLTQERLCALSGVPLTIDCRKTHRAESTASLDRKDSSLGYVPGNVQWVHKKLNLAKQDLSDSEFIAWCRLIVAHADKVLVDDPPPETHTGSS